MKAGLNENIQTNIHMSLSVSRVRTRHYTIGSAKANWGDMDRQATGNAQKLN